jgi:hypothetical protein
MKHNNGEGFSQAHISDMNRFNAFNNNLPDIPPVNWKKREYNGEFQLSASFIFLTYSSILLSKEEVLDQLNTILEGNIEMYVIGDETHKDGTSYMHVLLKGKQKYKICSPNKLDLKGNLNEIYLANYGRLNSVFGAIKYIEKHKNSIRNSLYKYFFPFQLKPIFNLDTNKDFCNIPENVFDWFKNEKIKKSLFLFGPRGTGKTEFAIRLLEEFNPIVIRDIRGLKSFSDDNKAIIFEYINWKNIEIVEKIALFGRTRPARITILYQTLIVDPTIIVVVVDDIGEYILEYPYIDEPSDYANTFIPTEEDIQTIKSRSIKVVITAPLFPLKEEQ